MITTVKISVDLLVKCYKGYPKSDFMLVCGEQEGFFGTVFFLETMSLEF